MSKFYGTLKGTRGKATRCGDSSSGMITYAAGWGGAIRVDVYTGGDGKDRYTVHKTPWKKSGGNTQLIAEGLLDSKDEVLSISLSTSPKFGDHHDLFNEGET